MIIVSYQPYVIALLSIVGATVYVRFKEVEQFFREQLITSTRVFRLNTGALYLGWGSAFCMSLVANFRESEIIQVHMVGAFGTFTLGIIYAWIQTAISFKMAPLLNNDKRLPIFRAVLCSIMSVTYVTLTVFGSIAFRQFKGSDPLKWGEDDGGYGFHIASTVSEWTMAIFMCVFILTFMHDFKRISLTTPEIVFMIEAERLDSIASNVAINDDRASPLDEPDSGRF